MNKKRALLMLLLLLVVLFTTLEGSRPANQPKNSKRPRKLTPDNGYGSSVILPVAGNVYPKGYYHVTLHVGHPPKPYFLDIDSGSDLTWLQCDAPCIKCLPAPHTLYKPNKNLVTCVDPLCTSLQLPTNKPCDVPNEQCDYVVEYADQGSSMGVLIRDYFALRFGNGSIIAPRITFGCGYNQEIPASNHCPYTDGVLGLADGKSGIVSQLHGLGLIHNVFSHCLSGKGGGFLFFGDGLIPSSGVTWMPMMLNSLEKHYAVGSFELLYGKQGMGVKGLTMIFDSGSTYSYFNSDAYKQTLSMVKKDLNGKGLKDAVEDQTLPVCWKGSKPFKSIDDVKNYCYPLILRFTKAKNVQLQLPPEAYLIITEHGNVCLGILNGTEVGLGKFNILGDISLQDKMVIYDNEKRQIGWVTANCDRLPNVDGDYMEGLSRPYAWDMGIVEQHSPAKYG
ncbi:aspartic proteinase Asp1-like [Diospyros lotus]|uniref:aspartic proteinase Asp1-like n=1 Tax=Diospyros lotus TaxID=55363 RepID=UPI00225A6203|nr:aspartic proteinase Asp1-like [Diospyros lotus]